MTVIAINISKERNKRDNTTSKRVEISQTKRREGRRKKEVAAEEMIQKTKERMELELVEVGTI
jgi:hypothetical protein